MTERATRADYRHWLAIPTRWMDNDTYGHVNNVQYYSFFDTVINEYLIRLGGLDPAAGQVIGYAVETHCQFHAPLTFPDVIDAGLRVARIGRSSVRYEVGLFPGGGGEAAANGYFVHVFVDRQTQRAVEIPASLRECLDKLQV